MEQRGALFTAILAHASQKPEPELDQISRMAFSFIVSQMDRDREKRAKAGRKGGEASGKSRRHDEANEANASCAKQAEAGANDAEQIEANEAVNVTVPVTVPVTVNDNVNSECIGQPSAAKRARARFKPPTVEEIAAYCRERGNDIDPQRFFDYNAARDWMLGKTKMKDWRAAVRTWERRDAEPAAEPVKIDFLEGT